MSLPLSLRTTHPESEDDPWKISLPDHATRSDSPGFRASKELAKKLLAALGAEREFYGSDNLQMHHGGSLWLLDSHGWLMVQNEAGIEWSAQFCADPKKVDELRANAKRLYDKFSDTVPEMVKLGYAEAQKILNTPISDAEGVSTWVDSIFNACVPLPAVHHVGVQPNGDGRHHYPTPITDIGLVKYDDFQLWVTDAASKQRVAVVPVAKRGAGVNRVRLAFAPAGTALAKKSTQHPEQPVEFDGTSPLTKQAFARQ